MWLSCSQKSMPCRSSIWKIFAIWTDYESVTYSIWKSLKIVDHVDFCNYALVHVVNCDLTKFAWDFIWSGSLSIFQYRSGPGLLSYVVLTLEWSEELLFWRAKVILKHLKLVICLFLLKVILITLRVISTKACTFLCTRYALCATWYLVPTKFGLTSTFFILN
jgi:hypothetical protein